jgi:hypothetical protein
MKVRKIHPYDGSEKAGKPIGDELAVVSIAEHKPVDGKGCGPIYVLEDGTWEFGFNLCQKVD